MASCLVEVLLHHFEELLALADSSEAEELFAVERGHFADCLSDH